MAKYSPKRLFDEGDLRTFSYFPHNGYRTDSPHPDYMQVKVIKTTTFFAVDYNFNHPEEGRIYREVLFPAADCLAQALFDACSTPNCSDDMKNCMRLEVSRNSFVNRGGTYITLCSQEEANCMRYLIDFIRSK